MSSSRSWKQLFILAFVTFCIIGSTADSDSGDTGDKSVVTLTSSNFDDFIKQNQITLVEFYAPWCGHCKKLEPEYEKAAKQLLEKGSAVRLGKVDATKEEDLAKKYDVSGYPTLKLIRNGVAEEYKGGRTADTIVSWIESMTGPPITAVASATVAAETAKKAPIAFVGAFTSESAAEYKTFKAVAESNRNLGTFIVYFEPKAKNEVVAYRKDEGATEKHAVKKEEDLKKFCNQERFPLFGGIDGQNYADYVESGRDLVWFAAEKLDYDSALKDISEAAKQFRAANNFVWLNTEQFKDHAQSALGVKDFPSLVLQTSDGRYLYPHNMFDTKKIVSFMKDVAAGKIEKFLMSDEIPEETDDAVKVVVGKSFKDMVFQKDKDVLLEVYAPWCGHCKKLEPIYKEFAEKNAGNKHLIVAKMDGTTNEAPVPGFETKGYPSLFFIKAGSETPEVYEGERTVEGLTAYLKEHASKPFGADVKEEL